MPALPSDVPFAPAIVADRDIVLSYAVDASFRPPVPADFTVVRARDEADVVAVLQEAQAHGIPCLLYTSRCV